MPEPAGAPTTEEAEDILIATLQAAATVDGNGTQANVDGYAGNIVLELNNQGAGTTTLNIEGSFDGTTWYAVGYWQKDNTLAPTRAVAAIAVGATPFAHVYAILDTYKLLRARMSASAGAVNLTATLRAYPV
jgi:hypothetical protein